MRGRLWIPGGHGVDDSAAKAIFYQKQIPMIVKVMSQRQVQHQQQQQSSPHLVNSNNHNRNSPSFVGSFSSNTNSISPLLSSTAKQSHNMVTVTIVNTGQKFLEITLTDETDPFFLYQLEIGPDDYLLLKEDQNLLIDFSQFPHKFVELLNECLSNSSVSSDNPRFVAQFVVYASSTTAPTESVLPSLSIIETNSFRNISHLSLQFTPGTDEDVKKYLATLVSQYRLDNQRLSGQLQSSEKSCHSEITCLQEENTKLRKDYESLKLENNSRENQLKLQLSDELSRERDRYQRERESFTRDAESSKNAVIARFEQQLSDNGKELTSCKARMDELIIINKSLESELRDLREANNRLITENATLRASTVSIDDEKHAFAQEKSNFLLLIESNKKQIEYLERSLNEKQVLLARLEQSSQAQLAEKANSDGTIADYKAKISDLEQLLKSQTHDNAKANEIIMKLQNELKNVKSKLKLKSAVSSQQEKLLEEKQSVLEITQKEYSEIKQDIGKKDEVIKSLETNIEQLKLQGEKDKKVIEENNSVIEWLHKQLNEDAVRRPFGSLPPAPVSRPGNYQFEKHGTRHMSTTALKYLNNPAGNTNTQNQHPNPAISKTSSFFESKHRSSGAMESNLPFKSNYFK